MRPMTCPTVTVSPAGARTSVRVPLAGAGSSTSTLSVEISTTVSSARTGSPGCLCHSRIVPSVTDSPAVGVTMSTTLAPAAGGAAPAPFPPAPSPAWSTSVPAASSCARVPGTGSPPSDCTSAAC